MKKKLQQFPPQPNDEKIRSLGVDNLLDYLQSGKNGLSQQAAQARLTFYGLNTIQERRKHPLLKFLSFFWGPIAWMIEAAAVLSAFVRDYEDLDIILVLLLFNAVVGFWQEYQAGNAIAQLKKQLALHARVRRDGEWHDTPAEQLVPGDIVRLRLGDIVPADIVLLSGDYLSIDQSALTGESLPVDKGAGDLVYSGSIAKQGEMTGVVVATGAHSFFGKTAKLVGSVKTVSHFQKAVLTIGDYLIFMSMALVAVLVLVGLERHLPIMELVQFALILTVASIPVAMPAVLSVTMAVGAMTLAKLKAIVSRLESIEELAGMDILCSDKTGTLTQNKLTLGDSALFNGADETTLILTAALAAEAENPDAIDSAILHKLGDKNVLTAYSQTDFIPFDPVSKRTEALIQAGDGKQFRVSKGAPQVVLDLCQPNPQQRRQAEEVVDGFAVKGYRALGVARTDQEGRWQFLGILSLFDPPREDARETIATAKRQGIAIKMVTGDNLAIAKQIAGQLGLGQNIVPAEQISSSKDQDDVEAVARCAEHADGFAQVFPEHKYRLVKSLQADHHFVGMTGDGVNDAPALKQADVGIAVSGATDAARAAADLVLTAPGLSVITHAIEEARRIFERMNAYAIYRITETIRIMLFMVSAILVYNVYPITAVMIILLALLNDLPILTIAKDNTRLPSAPVSWDMRRVLTVATVLGMVGVIETFLLLIIAKNHFHVETAQLQTIIFLKLAVAGHLTLFVARGRHFFLTRPYPAPLLLMTIIATQLVAVLIAHYGWHVTPISWQYIGLIWAYCLVWVFIEDGLKLTVYHRLEHSSPRHRSFLSGLRHSMHFHGKNNDHE
ncbi:plasma-membrane proton-efflux P-type ATPase [Methylomarinum vadi]|uniref:plasma-membrane proton-efflux P-type ATPase n=1 Tax=Methylomarinum vadi TaxID=438855 RepID=UPI00068E4B4E|nr:plasma-membrane proton-efflux P-type ATPase [Methylomarinum vadi]